MLRNYIKIAYRNIWKNKVYSIINIGGLTIGLTLCLVIYLLVSFELSYDTFHPNKEQIYRITSSFKSPDGADYYNSGVSGPVPKYLKQEVAGFEKIAAFHEYYAKVLIKSATENKKFPAAEWDVSKNDIIVCEPAYFEIFKYKWLIGNPNISLNAPNKVVLTAQKAKKYFGKMPLNEIVGRNIIYNDSLIAQVSGVVEDMPKNSDIIFKDFISFKSIENKVWSSSFGLNSWSNTNGSSQAYVLLGKNTRPKDINSKFTRFMEKHIDMKNDWNIGRKINLQPLSDIHFNSKIQDGYSRPVSKSVLQILMAIAGFILVIATINFVNLATAQSLKRVKEIGIRKVLGSDKRNLIYQQLIETLLITVLAVSLSVLMVEPTIYLFKAYLPSNLSFNLFSNEILLFLPIITVITCLLSGLYPAWVVSSFNPIASIKNQIATGNTRTALFRKWLITFQFAISQVFILGTILVASQSKYMLTKDMGFRKDAIVNVEVPWLEDIKKVKVFIDKIKQIPEIEEVAQGDSPARTGYSTTQLKFFNGKNEIKTDVHRKAVDNNFIKLYGLKILAGRNLSKSDTTNEFIINETYLKALGIKKPADAVGKMIDYYATNGAPMKFPIVGVLADYHFQSLQEQIKPLFFTNEGQSNIVNIKIKNLSTESLKPVLAKMELAYKAIYKGENDKFEAHFFDDTLAKFYEKETKMSYLLNFATGLAIFISCLGLFGLVAYSTSQKTKEIGIRKVLGASIASILGLLSKDFLKLIIISILIASPIAYYFMQEWLKNYSYKVDIDIWIFIMAAVCSIIIAISTISYQAIKAAMANPVKSLKVE